MDPRQILELIHRGLLPRDPKLVLELPVRGVLRSQRILGDLLVLKVV